MTSDAEARAAAQALPLLNALRQQLGQPPLEALDDLQTHQLAQAHPLLVMLADTTARRNAPSLEDRCHAWNKALRRRSWDRLPALERAATDPAEAVARVVELFALFGVTLAPGDVPAEPAGAAGAEVASLAARARALLAPPLTTPDRYSREHAAILTAYAETRERHPRLPPLL